MERLPQASPDPVTKVESLSVRMEALNQVRASSVSRIERLDATLEPSTYLIVCTRVCMWVS